MNFINYGKMILACAAAVVLTAWITSPKAEANIVQKAPTLSVARTAFGAHDYLVLQRDSTVVGFCHDPECHARETQTNNVSL